jgi:hypothetical protein
MHIENLLSLEYFNEERTDFLRLEKEWKNMKTKQKDLYIQNQTWYETEIESWNLSIEFMEKLKAHNIRCARYWIRNTLGQMRYFRKLRFDNTILSYLFVEEEKFWVQSFRHSLGIIQCLIENMEPKTISDNAVPTCIDQISRRDYLKNIITCDKKYKNHTFGNFTELIKINAVYIKIVEKIQTLKFSPMEHMMMHRELEKGLWAFDRLQSKYDEIQEFDSIEVRKF